MASSRLRTLLTTVAILLGVAAVMGSLTTIAAVRASLDQAAAHAAGRADLEVRALAEQGFPLGVVERVSMLEGVQLVAPLVEKRTFLRSPSVRGFVHLIGLDPAAEAQVNGLVLRDGRWPAPGEPGVALIELWAELHGLGLGSQVEMITRDGFQSFVVTGLVDDMGLARSAFGRTAFVSLETAQASFGMGERVTHLALKLDQPEQRERIARQLASLLPNGFVAVQPGDVAQELHLAAQELALGLALFGMAALFVGAFLIHNSLAMSVAEQRRQIGLLRTAGVTRGQVLVVVLLQATAMGAVGSLLGVIAGAALARSMIEWLTRLESLRPLEVAVSLESAALSLVVGSGLAALSAVLPARRATVITPLEGLRASEPSPRELVDRSYWWGVAGLAAAGGLALAWPLPAGPAAEVRTLGLFLWLAAAAWSALALVGPLSRLCALPFHWLLGPEARLAELNLRRAQHRAGLTVVGFIASLALIVALVALGSSTASVAQQRASALFPGEVLLVSPVVQPMRLLDDLRTEIGAGRVTPLRPMSVAWGAIWLDAMAIEPTDYAVPLARMLADGDPAEVARRLEAGGEVLLPIRLAEAWGLQPGHRLALQTLRGPTDFRVAGILSYSFPSSDNLGSIVLAHKDAVEHFGLDGFSLLVVEPGPVADLAGLSRLAERYGMEAVSVGEVQAAIGEAVARLLALFASLIAVGIVVAGLGIINTMMMNVSERTREIGVLRTLGLTRGQVQAMVLAEAGMMGLIGGLLGVAGGLGLAHLLLELARSPDLDLQPVWPIVPIALALVAAVAIAMAAALVPAHAAARVHLGVVDRGP